jgi:hypothetical protein
VAIEVNRRYLIPYCSRLALLRRFPSSASNQRHGDTVPWLQQMQPRRPLRRPGIQLEVGLHDFFAVFFEEPQKGCNIESVTDRHERCQIFFGERKKSHGRFQAPAMLWMRGMLKILFQMNKRTGRLNQPLEKIVISRVFVEPDLFKDVVRFVIALLVPALEVGLIKGMIHHLRIGRICVCPNQFRYEARNPLAFVHEEF